LKEIIFHTEFQQHNKKLNAILSVNEKCMQIKASSRPADWKSSKEIHNNVLPEV
jgi:hypothetical protein